VIARPYLAACAVGAGSGRGGMWLEREVAQGNRGSSTRIWKGNADREMSSMRGTKKDSETVLTRRMHVHHPGTRTQ